MAKKNTSSDSNDVSVLSTPIEKVDASESVSNPNEHEQEKEVSWLDVFDSLMESLKPDATLESQKRRDKLFAACLETIISRSKLNEKYNIVVLYDENTMLPSDIDKVYSTITNFKKKKQILLILHSMGGDIGSGYLIGKLCKEYSEGNFVIVVPRKAKSAATLLCCAADSLHLGSLSELGPIDPQIDRMPALGLKSSVEHIASLVQQYPGTAEMFARYLSYALKPIDLGYYERVAESAMQYAERLLAGHSGNLKSPAAKIAKMLVYEYKDHGFVIDKNEAQSIFGGDIVKFNTEEYKLANEIYNGLSDVRKWAGWMNNIFYFIGQSSTEPNFVIKRSK